MADLTDLQSALPVKVAGANPATGLEDNFLEVDTSGRITIRLNDGLGSQVNLGQAVMSASLPVAIASDQSAIPVTQSGTWNINNISGTISLPTGASTSANQTTQITSLQILDDVPAAQNGAFVKGNPIMGQLDDTSTVVATEDNVAVIRITPQRASHVNLRNQAGTEIGTTANPVGSKITDGTDVALVTTNGDQKVVDGIRNGGVYGALSIPTANTPVEAKVGGARLANRKFLQIYSNNNGLFWGLDNTVTSTSGTPVVNGQVLTFSIDPDSTFQVWLVGSSNSKSVQVTECP